MQAMQALFPLPHTLCWKVKDLEKSEVQEFKKTETAGICKQGADGE